MIEGTLDQQMTTPAPKRGTELRLIGGPYDGTTVPFKPGLFIEVPNPDKELYGSYDNLAYPFSLDVEVDPPEWVGIWRGVKGNE